MTCTFTTGPSLTCTFVTVPAWYHEGMPMTLRLPDDVDAALTERAEREHKSKAQLVVEAVQRDNERAKKNVESMLADLMNRHSKILDRLK